MTTRIEAVIQQEIKDYVRVYYYLIPSPKLGITAKCGMKITNYHTDPVWETLSLYCYTQPEKPTQRVLAEVAEDDPGGYDNVTVLSVEPIEEPDANN